MKKLHSCQKCNMDFNPNNHYNCPNCGQAGPISVEIPRIESANRKIKKTDQVQLGLDAASRTERYSTLFDNIGKVMQILNYVFVVILFFAGIFIEGSGFIQLIYWIAIVFLFAIAYIQTALIRGLASYFQMRASDHLIRYQRKD